MYNFTGDMDKSYVILYKQTSARVIIVMYIFIYNKENRLNKRHYSKVYFICIVATL